MKKSPRCCPPANPAMGEGPPSLFGVAACTLGDLTNSGKREGLTSLSAGTAGNMPGGEWPAGIPSTCLGEDSTSLVNRKLAFRYGSAAIERSSAVVLCGAEGKLAGVRGVRAGSDSTVGELGSLERSSEKPLIKGTVPRGPDASGDRRAAERAGPRAAAVEGRSCFSGVSSRSEAAQRGGWMRRPVRVAPTGRTAAGLDGSAGADPEAVSAEGPGSSEGTTTGCGAGTGGGGHGLPAASAAAFSLRYLSHRCLAPFPRPPLRPPRPRPPPLPAPRAGRDHHCSLTEPSLLSVGSPLLAAALHQV
jgi:hypothetical protein